MFVLWIITGVLSYAHKIPFIGRIITLLSLYYGRTTIWKILIRIRKLFVMFNAIIGVFIVFKTTGFSYDNVLAGFAGMGHTYLEIFINFTKRLFNWFFELFDYKIVPGGNPPKTPKIPNGGIYYPRGVDQGWYNKLYDTSKFTNDWFKGPLNININTTPWYKDLSTWLWLAGIASALGLCFVGYKLVSDPTFIEELFKKSNDSGGPTTNIAPAVSLNSSADSSPDINLFSKVTKSFVSLLNNTTKKLNPSYWFTSTINPEIVETAFKDQQYSSSYDKRYYPFTNVNPFNSWFDRVRIAILGETVAEKAERIEIRSLIWESLMPSNRINTPSISGSSTPLIGNVGLGISKISGSNFLDAIETSTSYQTTWNKIASLPATPKAPLSPLPGLGDVIPSWKDHTIKPENISEYFGKGKYPERSYAWIVTNRGKHK